MGTLASSVLKKLDSLKLAFAKQTVSNMTLVPQLQFSLKYDSISCSGVL